MRRREAEDCPMDDAADDPAWRAARERRARAVVGTLKRYFEEQMPSS